MVGIDFLITLVPLMPLLGFLIVALSGKSLGQGVTSVIACGTVLVSFFVSFFLSFGRLDAFGRLWAPRLAGAAVQGA